MFFFRTRYRVVTDTYSGFEAQYRYWWMPFYLQIGINTHATVEAARAFIDKHKHSVIWQGY